MRRRSYQADDEDRFSEEVARIFGVPFEVIPFKEAEGAPPAKKDRHRVYAVPEKQEYAITFPRVVGYAQAVSDDFCANWDSVPRTILDPMEIPPETEMQGWMPSTHGRMSLSGIGKIDTVSLKPLREKMRLQQLEFGISADLSRILKDQRECQIPIQALFPRILQIVRKYFESYVEARSPFEKVDVWHSPFYGLVLERLNNLIVMTREGRPTEMPVLEKHRPLGSTSEVDYWTTKDLYTIHKSHLNAVVADTKQLEQAAAFHLDRSDTVEAFVKNTVDIKGDKTSLGFSIPFLHQDQQREYYPDFIVRLNHGSKINLILETKGFPDPEKEDKAKAAERWVQAINQDGRFGQWKYAIVLHPSEMGAKINEAI